MRIKYTNFFCYEWRSNLHCPKQFTLNYIENKAYIQTIEYKWRSIDPLLLEDGSAPGCKVAIDLERIKIVSIY